MIFVLILALLVPHKCTWDLDLVDDIFNARDAALIKGMPLSLFPHVDKWIGGGNYSVCSAYLFFR